MNKIDDWRIADWCEKYTHLMRLRTVYNRKGEKENAARLQAEMDGMRFALWTLAGYIPVNDGEKIIVAKP